METKNKLQKRITIALIVALTLSLFLSRTDALHAEALGTSSETKDVTEPADVENLKAIPGDGEVKLSWNYNAEAISYKIYRGTRPIRTIESRRYDLPVIPVGNVTSYTVKNLTNDNTYYFSATALDAAGNESSNYSLEASATPKSGLRISSALDNGKSPQVKSVESEDIITVKVVFTEPIRLPQEHPQSAFTIEKIIDKSRLVIQQSMMDSRDETGQTVLLITEPQEENEEYLLTAGLEIQDYSGNPVVSGTSDTGSFKGSAQKKAVTPTTTTDDTSPLTIVSGVADFNNRMSINFSKQIILPANAVEQFKVYKKGTQESLKLINASLSVDGKTIYLTTNPQVATEYEVQVLGVKSVSGDQTLEPITITVTGRGSSIEDLIPPEDVTELVARIKNAQKNLVELRWKSSKNSAGDLADQLLYQGEGNKAVTFGKGAALGSTTTAAEIEDLKGGKWYTFKVTTKDASKNESKGAVVSVYLPETGPGMVAAGLTALAMGVYKRRKKGKKA